MKKMFDHKEQRFSIRKYSCGAASVLIGCVLFMGGQAVSADEQVTTDTSIETSQVNTAAKNNIQNTTGSTAVAPQTATTQKEVVEKAPAPVRSSATMMSVEKSSVDTQETTKIVDKTASAATDTRRVQSTTVDAATQTEDETTNSSVDATTDTATPSTTVKVEKNPAEKEAGKKEIDVAKLMDKTQTAHEARLAESKVIQTVPSLPSQGYYTYTKRTEVKNEPKASAALQFYVNAGDRVYYDRVLVADGYQWLSYRSYSGIRRYAAINKLVTEPVQPAKPTPSSTGTLPSRGRYTFSETAEVKNEAKWSAPTQFTFNRGDSVNYDKVLENDGYQWISYISYSGMRRYAAVTKLAQPAPQRPAQSQVTGTIHIENKTSQGFDVVMTNVSSTKGVKTVKLPIWSSQGGQDDVIWYDAIKQIDGTYKLSVDIRRHKNNRGEYNIHMYYIQSDGSLQGVTGTTTKVEEPKYSVTGTIHIENKTSQGFDVLITNVSDSNGISRVKVPIWTENSGQDDIIWYDASKQNDGNYKVTVNISKHKNESGEYNIHLYYIEPNGKIRGVSGTKTIVVAPSSARESIPSQGVYTFKKEVEVKNSPTMTAKTEFTFARGERIRYDKVLDADHHQWISYVSYSGTRRYIPIATLTNEEAPKPVQVTGTIHIENKTSQGFDVVVTNVSSTKGVKTVKLPIWSSQGGQDDVIWYDAIKQTDGTYKLSVDIRRHKNNYGDYNVHMYYVQSDGSLQGVTGTTTKVEEPKYSVTGTIHIENKTSQGFDVVVTNVSSTKGVKTVKLPIWSSQGGQDDVIWYDAVKQTDGTYKLSVDIRRHKNNYGDYNVHMYYVQSDGSLQGVTGTTTKVEEPKYSVTGTIHIENKTSQGFDVVVTNVSSTKGVKTVKLPIWSSQGGQDDVIWYDAVKQTDGTYKLSVDIRRHKNNYGDYNVHMYYVQSDGSLQGVTGTTTKVEEPKYSVTGTIHIENKTSQGFDVVVTNVSSTKGVKTVKLPIWSSQGGQDDVIWYDAVKQTDGTYKLSVDIRRHKNNYGDYNVHMYYVQSDGSLQGVTGTTTKVEEPKYSVTGTIHIENKTSQGFDVVVTNVSSTKGVKTVKLPIWSSQGGQDDVIWYDAVKQTDGTYKLSVDIRRHKNNYGDYNVHMYYVQSDGSLQGVTGTTTKVEEPKYSVTGTIHIENKTSQGFDVVVTNVSSTKGVKTVKLPIWSSQGGQDDVIWYDAVKQTDGTYKLSVDIRRHKNNRGEYNIHMYYVQSDGSLQGVTGTTTKVDGPQTGAKEVQYNGSYYFIQGKYDEIVVANKKHPMAANYNPGENPTAKAAFLRLRNDMIAQGYNVGYAYSGFRSYDYQKVLYQNYVNKDGQAAADRYSARPGYSEHQTGLVFDLTDKAGNLLEDAAASNWLKNNAHRYGFVVRYQPGKEASTGYMPEAWHIRYIGKEADEVYHSGLSLEEYYGFEGGDYASSVTPSKPTTPSPQTPSIPAQGVYRFTKRSSIKAEARMSAPELAYYDAGQSVTYDKVLNADGATWISYIAFSGKRRYIAVA